MNIDLIAKKDRAASRSSSGIPLQIVSTVLKRRLRAFDGLVLTLILRPREQLAPQIVEPFVSHLQHMEAVKAQNVARSICGCVCSTHGHRLGTRAAGLKAAPRLRQRLAASARTRWHCWPSLQAHYRRDLFAAPVRMKRADGDPPNRPVADALAVDKTFRGEAEREALREDSLRSISGAIKIAGR
jgi:hypothetical protein